VQKYIFFLSSPNYFHKKHQNECKNQHNCTENRFSASAGSQKEVVIRHPLLFTTQNHYPDLGEWFTSLCFTESSMESRFVIPFSSTACPDKI
jgi:hypothetical protein